MMQIIDSNGNNTTVKNFDDYIKTENKLDPPLFTEVEFNYGYSLCDPTNPNRLDLQIKHLRELIKAQWFYSRFLNKQYMDHYYYENFRLHDELKKLLELQKQFYSEDWHN